MLKWPVSCVRFVGLVLWQTRLQHGHILAVLPITGYAVVAGFQHMLDGVLLGALGLLFHIFYYGSNDLFDLEVDRQSPYRRASPLIRGELSGVALFWAVSLVVPAMFIIVGVVANDGAARAVAALGIAIVSALTYNWQNKRRGWPRFMIELMFGVSFGAMCLVGSWAASPRMPVYAGAFALAATVVAIKYNVYGGLKDLKTDFESGSASSAIVWGARMVDDDAVSIPSWFAPFVLTLQAGVFLLLLQVGWMLSLPWYAYVVVVFLSVHASIRATRLLRMRSYIEMYDRGQPMLADAGNYLSLLVVAAFAAIH